MATVTIRPNGDYYRFGYTAQGGGIVNLYAAVDEEVLDTGDFVAAQNDDSWNLILFEWSSCGLSNVTINKLTLYVEISSKSWDNVDEFYASIGSDTEEDPNLTNNDIFLLADYSDQSVEPLVLTTNPDTGNSWSISEINSLRLGFLEYYNKNSVSIYQAYIEVDYTASSGTTHEGEVALSSLSYLRTKKA